MSCREIAPEKIPRIAIPKPGPILRICSVISLRKNFALLLIRFSVRKRNFVTGVDKNLRESNLLQETRQKYPSLLFNLKLHQRFQEFFFEIFHRSIIGL